MKARHAFGSLAVSGALVLCLFGCAKGNVVVSPTQAGAADVTDAGASVSSHGGAAGVSGSTGPQVSAVNHEIYFERVLPEDGLPRFTIGVSMLPQSAAEGVAPFGVKLRVPQPFGSEPIFVAGGEQVIYLRSTGIGSDSLDSSSILSMENQPLFTFPAPVAAFTLSSDGSLLAWAGQDGSLSSAALKGKQDASDSLAVPHAVNLKGNFARSVQWNASGTWLLMRTDTDAWLFASDASGQLSRQAIIQGVAAAVFSPEGDRVAYVTRKDSVLHVTALPANSAATALGTLQSSEIYDLSWSAHGLTYWARLSSGQQEIRWVDTSQGADSHEQVLARLSVPSRVRGGVVCPQWVDGGVPDGRSALYFSDFVDGEYVVERLGTQKGEAASPTPFAQPLSQDEGFVCPRSQ